MKIVVFDDKFSIGHFILGLLFPLFPSTFIVFFFFEFVEHLYKNRQGKVRESSAAFAGDITEFLLGVAFAFMTLRVLI